MLVAEAKPKRGGAKKGASPSANNDKDELPAREVLKLGMISGAAAGTIVDFVLFPLDTIKTRLQTKGVKLGADIFKGMYNGILPAVVASAPGGASFFGAYDLTKKLATAWLAKYRPDKDNSSIVNIAAAIGADLTSSLVRTPFETMKQQVQAGKHLTSLEAFQAILKHEGIAGLYNGYFSLAARELPFDLIQFPMYEAMKAELRRRSGSEELPVWQSSLCGSVSGAFAAGLTTPLDVVKTRIMTEEASSVVGAFKSILAEEGASALFCGVIPRMIWISLGGAIFFGGYEATRKMLEPRMRKNLKKASQAKLGVNQRACL